MDPNATYSAMIDSLAELRCTEAAELADALIGWIRRGGFLPYGIRDRSGLLAELLEIRDRMGE